MDIAVRPLSKISVIGVKRTGESTGAGTPYAYSRMFGRTPAESGPGHLLSSYSCGRQCVTRKAARLPRDATGSPRLPHIFDTSHDPTPDASGCASDQPSGCPTERFRTYVAPIHVAIQYAASESETATNQPACNGSASRAPECHTYPTRKSYSYVACYVSYCIRKTQKAHENTCLFLTEVVRDRKWTELRVYTITEISRHQGYT
ncbi:hypothetical protein AB4305_33550 [Nocardia sp. 2YAB30]|uniref:hypothetical protein n=1 Tax=Nocardia sp. 2YAB30 TaxID=3233022 RepID=UPI003F9D4BDA